MSSFVVPVCWCAGHGPCSFETCTWSSAAALRSELVSFHSGPVTGYIYGQRFGVSLLHAEGLRRHMRLCKHVQNNDEVALGWNDPVDGNISMALR